MPGQELPDDDLRFRTFVRMSRDGIVIVDREGTIVEWNEGEEGITGIAATEALGCPIWQVQHRLAPLEQRDLGFVERARDKALAGLREGLAISRSLEDEIQRPDGSRRIVQSILFPVPQGAELFVGSISRDVTEHKLASEQLRVSEERLALAVDASGQGLWDWDVANDVAYLSPQYCSISGYASGTVERALEFFRGSVHPDDLPSVDETMASHFRSEIVRSTVEYRLRRQAGDYVWVRGVGRVTHRDAAGTPLRMTGVIADITETKRLEQQAAQANRQKDEFLALLSHELRNPLAPVRNSLQVLARAETSGDQARRMLSIIERQVSQLTRLVDDLLDVARVSHGKMQVRPERIDLAEIVRRTLEDYASGFDTLGLEVHSQVPPAPAWVDADPARMVQVLGNLLVNAAKFTPRGGRVAVSLAREGEHVALTVSDTGAGIRPEMLDRLFDPFTQARETIQQTRGGLGLGLALVKGLVALHGGTVTASSDGPGLGARFSVRLPLSKGTQPPSALPDHGAC